jgi:hypothetical protein
MRTKMAKKLMMGMNRRIVIRPAIRMLESHCSSSNTNENAFPMSIALLLTVEREVEANGAPGVRIYARRAG